MCGGQAPEHQGTAPSDRVSISTRVKHIGSRPVINRISSGAMWNHSKKEEQENRRKKKKKKRLQGEAGGGQGPEPRILPAGGDSGRDTARAGGGHVATPCAPRECEKPKKITTKWAAPRCRAATPLATLARAPRHASRRRERPRRSRVCKAPPKCSLPSRDKTAKSLAFIRDNCFISPARQST